MTRILSDLQTRIREAFTAKFAEEHGKRVADRAAINGQPNGYKPVTEAELQFEKKAKALREECNKAYQDGLAAALLEPNFGKIVA